MTGVAQVAAPLRLGVATVSRIMVLSVAAIDLSILTRWVGGGIGPLSAIGGHLLAVALLALLALALNRRAAPHIALLALLLAMAGPLGSFMVLVARLDGPLRDPIGQGRGDARPEDGDGEVPAPEDALFASIRQGRRADGAAHRLHSLELTFRTGDLAEQQGALKAISRDYDPSMLPALRQALGSPRPAVRVQAAAVFARLRGLFSERAKAALASDPSQLTEAAAKAFASDCRAIAASGFVGPDVAEALLRQAGRMPTLADRTPVRQPGPRAPLAPPPRLKRHSCGGVA